jgi:hypothetical protein
MGVLPVRAPRARGDDSRPRRWRLYAAGLAALLHGAPLVAGPKTDVVVLVNGDHITGEIRGLERNRLRVSTEHMGTVSIEWDKVASVQSDQSLLLEAADGTRRYGQVAPGAEPGTLEVRPGDAAAARTVPLAAIVRAGPVVGGRLLDRLDGYVSAGFDTSKASGRTSLDASAGLASRTRVRQWNLDASANVTDDSAGDTSERFVLGGSWRQFHRARDFYLGFGSLERNTALDLNLRFMTGAGYGRYFVQSSTAEWLGGLGLAYAHENYRGGSRVDSVEAVLRTGFSVFRYDYPETDVGGTLTLLPSLTERGRVRAEGDLRAKYEFVDDLYLELKLYGSYDSKPPIAGAERSDYGVVTSLGYTF